MEDKGNKHNERGPPGTDRDNTLLYNYFAPKFIS